MFFVFTRFRRRNFPVLTSEFPSVVIESVHDTDSHVSEESRAFLFLPPVSLGVQSTQCPQLPYYDTGSGNPVKLAANGQTYWPATLRGGGDSPATVLCTPQRTPFQLFYRGFVLSAD
ncbi:hypothetical protein ACJJTC_013160 [Scirpophaga incertulas]